MHSIFQARRSASSLMSILCYASASLSMSYYMQAFINFVLNLVINLNLQWERRTREQTQISQPLAATMSRRGSTKKILWGMQELKRGWLLSIKMPKRCTMLRRRKSPRNRNRQRKFRKCLLHLRWLILHSKKRPQNGSKRVRRTR